MYKIMLSSEQGSNPSPNPNPMWPWLLAGGALLVGGGVAIWALSQDKGGSATKADYTVDTNF